MNLTVKAKKLALVMMILMLWREVDKLRNYIRKYVLNKKVINIFN